MILEYEIKKFRREPFRPSLFIDVSAAAYTQTNSDQDELQPLLFPIAEKKAAVIEPLFTDIFAVPITELPRVFYRESVLDRVAIRAEEAGLESRYAEVFATDLVVR